MINVGIVGYGNIGKGIEVAVSKARDMELKAVFTRRDPKTLTLATEGVPTVSLGEIENWQGKIDVLLLCGGSATDLPKQTPKYARYFNVIDSFDTHARIPEHFANVDKSAKDGGHLGLIS